MNRDDRSSQRYTNYYIQFYEVAYKDAKVGQTTEYEARMSAEHQANVAALRIMCQTDLYFLATEIYNMRNAREPKSKRLRWYEPFHGLLCDELGQDEDSLIQMSRNMMKTTFAKIWIIQQVLRDPVNVAIGMWSMSSTKARDELKSIKMMALNKKLVELFPDRLVATKKQFSKDNADSFTITRAVSDEEMDREIMPDEDQVRVWGLDGNFTGAHYTHVYLDDIITNKNTTTITQIEKAREVYGTIQGLKNPETIEKNVCTPWHSMDLYEYIKAEGIIEKAHTVFIPGVTGDLGNEQILYPYFTKKFLSQQRKKMGDNLYAAQYHLDTTPREGRMFIPPYPRYTEDMFPDDPKYYISVDPSTGRSEKHDKTGICVGAVSKSRPSAVYYVEAKSYKVEPEELANLVLDKIVQYRPVRVGIEYGLQYALRTLILLKMQERSKQAGTFFIPDLFEIRTGGGVNGKNKADKINRTFGAMIRDQRAFLTSDMAELEFQMNAFNPEKQKNDDDILDAAAMLIMTIEHFSAGHWFQGEQRVTQSLNLEQLFKPEPKTQREMIFAN